MPSDEELRKIRDQEEYLERRRQETAEYYTQSPAKAPAKQRRHAPSGYWTAFIGNLVLPGLGFFMIRSWVIALIYLSLALSLALTFWQAVPIVWLISLVHLPLHHKQKYR